MIKIKKKIIKNTQKIIMIKKKMKKQKEINLIELIELIELLIKKIKIHFLNRKKKEINEIKYTNDNFELLKDKEFLCFNNEIMRIFLY